MAGQNRRVVLKSFLWAGAATAAPAWLTGCRSKQRIAPKDLKMIALEQKIRHYASGALPRGVTLTSDDVAPLCKLLDRGKNLEDTIIFLRSAAVDKSKLNKAEILKLIKTALIAIHNTNQIGPKKDIYAADLAIILAKKGLFEEALNMSRWGTRYTKALIYMDVISIMVKKNMFDRALNIAEHIDYNPYMGLPFQKKALWKIGYAMKKAGYNQAQIARAFKKHQVSQWRFPVRAEEFFPNPATQN